MQLARQVVATFDADLDLKNYKDEYRDGLRRIIDAKIAGEEIVAPELQDPPKVVDLMGGAAAQPRLGQHDEEEAGEGDAGCLTQAKGQESKVARRQEGRYGLIAAPSSRRRSARIKLYSVARFQTRVDIPVSWTALRP